MSKTKVSDPVRPVDLAAEREALGPRLLETIERVVASGAYVLGPEVAAFEAEFAAFQRARFGIGVNSGTDALIIGLRTLGIGRGDRVLTTPFTFFASAGTIAWVGAQPAFCDVDPDTALLDTGQVEAALDSNTKCVLPVHLYGQLCDMHALREIADRRGIAILEDGAQCHGAARDGVRCGELGDVAAFSFYPTKNLGALGEGGMLITRNEQLAKRARGLRDHGSTSKYKHSEIGTNTRLQGLQGAVLRLKLPYLEAWNARRAEIAATYDRDLADHTSLRPLRRHGNTTHAYHQYTVRVLGEPGTRDRVHEALAERGITTAVHYPQPVHLQEAARPFGYGPGDFPAAELLATQVLCLPVHPFLSDDQISRVSEAIREVTPA